jgi:hypothetical protein
VARDQDQLTRRHALEQQLGGAPAEVAEAPVTMMPTAVSQPCGYARAMLPACRRHRAVYSTRTPSRLRVAAADKSRWR